MNYYFAPHIKEEGIRMNPPSNINSKWRYSLEIPFKDSVSDGPVAYVILKNPSQAGIIEDNRTKSDMTVNKVCIYFYVRGFSKVVILNLAGIYATDLSTISHKLINQLVASKNEPNANDNEIHKQLRKFRNGIDVIAVGWGKKNKVKGDYDSRIHQVLAIIDQYTEEIFEYPSDSSYPIHPAAKEGWNNWEELVPFKWK
ncbi:DUF1643 domain-containing protein [Bacillus wiedmannii]|uniref:DUF1643 domain-containing protein n=1 Tax=Bacillus wiedmannii TaxID=1890302 RepID=UPI0024AE33DD|nr:DUF1643 domain-containing protein [Bacillus wiedmannii]MDI6678232.1 DUF1643 domain-containing protein [Bacillus wiedmannii]